VRDDPIGSFADRDHFKSIGAMMKIIRRSEASAPSGNSRAIEGPVSRQQRAYYHKSASLKNSRTVHRLRMATYIQVERRQPDTKLLHRPTNQKR
jgi:hypothetical protein